MAFDKTDDFSIELSDADLDEINGGLQIVKYFPVGIIDPEFINIKDQLVPEIRGFPLGTPTPIDMVKDMKGF